MLLLNFLNVSLKALFDALLDLSLCLTVSSGALSPSLSTAIFLSIATLPLDTLLISLHVSSCLMIFSLRSFVLSTSATFLLLSRLFILLLSRLFDSFVLALLFVWL